MVKLYKLINSDIYGKVALKIHTGEQGGKNFLPRSFVKAVQEQIPGSVIVETNTAYGGGATLQRATAKPLWPTAGIFARWILWMSTAR